MGLTFNVRRVTRERWLDFLSPLRGEGYFVLDTRGLRPGLNAAAPVGAGIVLTRFGCVSGEAG